MHVELLPLLGALVAGSPVAADVPTAPATPAIVQTNGPGGVLPTPGMGPPGAVAGFGANPIAPLPPATTMPAPAPLVGAKFIAPKGVRVTAFPGSSLSRMYDTPTVMGLRPGYVYRFELTNLPYNPGKALYPEVELRGVLVPRPGMKYVDYPLPLVFSEVDLARVLAGALITKVIYLEDPEKAIPSEVQPDYPIETLDETESEAFKNARSNGRLMAIVRLGDRKPTVAELQTVAVNGTILLPGERYLRAPLLPSVFPYFACPLYDPLLGARLPKEECFPNGGDKKDVLGIGPDGRLGGLNPTDVGVEYTIDGKRRVTTSNMASICSPRFVIRRVEVLPMGVDVRVPIAAHVGKMTPSSVRDRSAAMAEIAREKANEVASRLRPSAYVGKVGTLFFIGTSKPVVIGQVEGVKVVAALVEPEQLTAYPSLGPIAVTKTIDPSGPRQAGDVVTITVRYANTGTKGISEVVVSDSLSGRLEYVPGSAQSDRAANFTMAENEVGSVILRWDLPGEVLPGQAGTIKFKAKVR